jgi:hypothetical protein
MKNNKIKALVKAARKTAKEEIQTSLIANLKEVTAKLKHGSKKLDKKIEKGAKILAKKIVKDLVIDGPALQKEKEAAVTAATPAPVTAKTNVKKEAAKAKPAKAEAAEVTAS